MKVQLVWAWFHEMPGSLIRGQQMSQNDDEFMMAFPQARIICASSSQFCITHTVSNE